MKFVFTRKAELLHVGKEGAVANPENDFDRERWLMNEFIVPAPSDHATIARPKQDGMVRKPRIEG